MKINKAEKLYFKNLDGLRFIAAFLVLLFHCGRIDQVTNGRLSDYTQFFRRASGLGVDLFFAISGFLITYLLISELTLTNKISVKNFYLKRVLRIWPLYFGIGVVGIVLGPFLLNKLGATADIITTGQTMTNIGFLFIFSVNWQILFNFFNAGAIGTFWSVCIEEQFYLIWAPLLNVCKNKVLNILLFTTFIGLLFILFLTPAQAYYNTIARFFNFGLGGLLAYLIFYKKNIEGNIVLKFFLNEFIQWVLALLSILYTMGSLSDIISPKAEFFINALISTYWVLNAISTNSILKFENKFFKHLGKISYGFYIFHLFCIQFFVKLYQYFNLVEKPIFYYLFWLFPFILVVLISTISFEFYEKHFLKLKSKLK